MRARDAEPIRKTAGIRLERENSRMASLSEYEGRPGEKKTYSALISFYACAALFVEDSIFFLGLHFSTGRLPVPSRSRRKHLRLTIRLGTSFRRQDSGRVDMDRILIESFFPLPIKTNGGIGDSLLCYGSQGIEILCFVCTITPLKNRAF